jgi:hypothetical protein
VSERGRRVYLLTAVPSSRTLAGMTPPPVRTHVSDPPPKPVALLEAVRAGAVVVDEHLLLHDIDRWLVCDREMGWVLVDAPVNGHVRIDVDTLTLSAAGRARRRSRRAARRALQRAAGAPVRARAGGNGQS